MKRNDKRILLVPGCLIILISFLFSGVSRAEDDWQYWSEYNISYKMTDRLSFILNPSLRIKDDISENQYWESRQGFSYKFNDHWNLSIFYLHSESKNSVNKWIDENTCELQPTFKWKWAGFDLANRFRLTYRVVDGLEKWRYREQIKIARNIKVFDQELIPFVSEELFYDESVDQMNQNRARVGISRKISKKITATVFYQYKSDAVKQNWHGENIVGTGLDLTF